MNYSIKMLQKVGVTLASMCLALTLITDASAQGNNGRGKCMQPFGISFYLVKPGYEDEWLEKIPVPRDPGLYG